MDSGVYKVGGPSHPFLLFSYHPTTTLANTHILSLSPNPLISDNSSTQALKPAYNAELTRIQEPC